MFISLGTIVLWCLASVLEPWLGDMGQIALLSMVTFYATGSLSQEDFNNYPWTIVVLAMGGLALGKAVSVSGLLATIATIIQEKLENAELFTILAVFGFIVLVMATFVSHTVAALIIIPLIAEIGRSLPDPHPNILVMCTALICSCAMGLPTSGFPNVTAIGLTNNVGEKYLNVGTFIKIGVPASFGCGLVVITVGYLCLRIIGI
jgi:phosphate transporter